jgi:hypothetical protein
MDSKTSNDEKSSPPNYYSTMQNRDAIEPVRQQGTGSYHDWDPNAPHEPAYVSPTLSATIINQNSQLIWRPRDGRKWLYALITVLGILLVAGLSAAVVLLHNSSTNIKNNVDVSVDNNAMQQISPSMATFTTTSINTATTTYTLLIADPTTVTETETLERVIIETNSPIEKTITKLSCITAHPGTVTVQVTPPAVTTFAEAEQADGVTVIRRPTIRLLQDKYSTLR